MLGQAQEKAFTVFCALFDWLNSIHPNAGNVLYVVVISIMCSTGTQAAARVVSAAPLAGKEPPSAGLLGTIKFLLNSPNFCVEAFEVRRLPP
jgi:hypothetical protein